MTGPESQNKRLNPYRLALLGVIALLIALGVFFAVRPVAPRELKQLRSYRGELVVNHSEAILNANLPTENVQKITRLLSRYRFKDGKESDALQNADLELIFEDGTSIRFLRGTRETLVLVTTPDGEDPNGYYRLGEDAYTEVMTLIYEAFPGGVQPLDLDTWWENMLAFATPLLLQNDFKSTKEVAPEAIVLYTYYQMVADHSVLEFHADMPGQTLDLIPYDQLLNRARIYFADGATATIKQSPYFDATNNTFVFQAMPQEYYEAYPYQDRENHTINGNYKLISVIRKNNGDVEATFEDYNRLGFRDEGTLTKYHYLVMTPTTEGNYRFVSKRSELASPEEISVEGYFMGHSTIASFTADEAYDLDLGDGLSLGENLLLYSVRYSRNESRLDLYLVSADYGQLLTSHTIEAAPGTSFWDIKTNNNTVIVKSNQAIHMLDQNLQELSQTVLPLGSIPSMDALGYDVTFDMESMIYSDDTGIHLYDFRARESTLVLEHPDAPQQPDPDYEPPTPALATDREEIELYRRPTFVMNGTRAVVSVVDNDGVVGYSLITLGSYPYATRLAIEPEAGAAEFIDNEKIVVSRYPDLTVESTGQPYTTHWVLYFSSGSVRRFSTPYDADASTIAISSDYLYFFHEDDRADDESDHYYRLYRMNLRTLLQEELSILIQNAVPDLLAVSDGQRVLFSYRAPAGSGFGITRNQ